MTREEAEEYAKEMTYRDAINNLMKARSIPYRKATFIKVNELLNALEQEPCNELPTVAIPQDNNGCENCRWQSRSESEMPCKQCMHNYTDEWEMEKPTDTITMTREEFSEKLMEHYRQGRADEKAYQNGEIMQFFSPD